MIRLHTPLCDLLGIRYPVMQAGMGIYRGLLTTPALVAAVSNAGGIGCIGGSGLLPEELRAAIRQTRALTDHPFGVDLIIPAGLTTRQGSREEIRDDIRRNHPEHWALVQSMHDRFEVPRTSIAMEFTWTNELTDAQVDVVFEERVPLLVVALGDPTGLMARARAQSMLIGGLVGSLGNLRRQVTAGVDLIICQGSEAGGHVGSISTLALLPQVLDGAAGIPVVAAGGIGDGRGLAAALAFGAHGAWCGSAFLFAEEAYLHPDHRAQLCAARSESLVAGRIYTGKTSRTVRNPVHEVWAESGLEPLGMPHQKVLMEDFLDAARACGRLDLVSNPGGQIAGMFSTTRPAAEIFNAMVADAATRLRAGARLTLEAT